MCGYFMQDNAMGPQRKLFTGCIEQVDYEQLTTWWLWTPRPLNLNPFIYCQEQSTFTETRERKAEKGLNTLRQEPCCVLINIFIRCKTCLEARGLHFQFPQNKVSELEEKKF